MRNSKEWVGRRGALLILMTVFLGGCGGGGGGAASADPPPPPPPSPTLSLSQTSVAVSAIQGAAAPASANITLSIAKCAPHPAPKLRVRQRNRAGRRECDVAIRESRRAYDCVCAAGSVKPGQLHGNPDLECVQRQRLHPSDRREPGEDHDHLYRRGRHTDSGQLLLSAATKQLFGYHER